MYYVAGDQLGRVFSWGTLQLQTPVIFIGTLCYPVAAVCFFLLGVSHEWWELCLVRETELHAL